MVHFNLQVHAIEVPNVQGESNGLRVGAQATQPSSYLWDSCLTWSGEISASGAPPAVGAMRNSTKAPSLFVWPRQCMSASWFDPKSDTRPRYLLSAVL